MAKYWSQFSSKKRINTTQSLGTKGTIPFELWGLKINQSKIVKNHKWAIQAAFNGPMAKQYWTNKHHTPAVAVDDLDSLAMEWAFSKITAGHRWQSILPDTFHMERIWYNMGKFLSTMPTMSHKSGRQNTYTQVPNTKCTNTVGD